MQGEAKIKRRATRYLKHPDMIDSTSDQATRRYAAYIDGAEFDDYPADTLRSMLGAMTKGQSTIELPEKLAYLEQNVDGDGMPLEGLRDICYKNLQEVQSSEPEPSTTVSEEEQCTATLCGQAPQISNTCAPAQ